MSVNILPNQNYWSLSAEEVLNNLRTKDTGLTENEILSRQKQFGLNLIQAKKFSIFSIILRQLTGNPLILILTVATFTSFLLGQRVSAFYIFWMIIVSISLGVWNEFTAERTIENLLKKITPSALVVRNGEKQEILVSHLTLGDVVLLSQGS